MGDVDARVEEVLKTLQDCCGVIAVKVLSEEEKREILKVEGEEEEKIIFGMCRSLNEGVREALKREFTVAMIIDTSKFQYPHHPYIIMKCGDKVLGELIGDEEKIEELRRDPSNLFLWRNFVVYMKRLPRDPKERKKMRVIYLSREPPQLQSLSYIRNSVFGTPSTRGDILIKRMLTVQSQDPNVGTCLIGFNIER